MGFVRTFAPLIPQRIARSGMARRAAHNFSWLAAEKLTALGMALIVSIQVARYLGPSEFGVLSYVMAVAALAAPLATLGINHILTKELTQHPDAAGRTLGTAALLRKAGALLAVAAVGAWALFAPATDARVPGFALLLVAAGLVGSLEFLQYWFLTSRKMNAYSAARMTNSVLFSVIRIAQIYLGASLEAFVIVTAVETIGAGALTYVAYRRARTTPIRWSFDAALAKKLLSRSWPLTFAALASAVYHKIDVIMIAEMASTAEAGVYAVAARFSEVWYFIPTMLLTALFPALLELKAKSAEAYQRHMQNIYDALAAAGTLVAVVVTIVAVPMIDLLFGPAYAPAALILSIHVWSGVFIFMRAMLGKWLIIEDLYIFSLVTQGAGTIVNVALNFYMIPRYGAVGAAIATLVSYASASYLALALHPRTRPMFVMMTRSLFWPRRLPELVRLAQRRRRRAAPGDRP